MKDIRFEKLPKWARDHIAEIERERDVAIRALNEYCDGQTPSPIYVDKLESTGEEQGPTTKRRYFQGHRVTIEWTGVVLDIILRDDCIDIGWSNQERSASVVYFVPWSFQQAHLFTKWGK